MERVPGSKAAVPVSKPWKKWRPVFQGLEENARLEETEPGGRCPMEYHIVYPAD